MKVIEDRFNLLSGQLANVERAVGSLSQRVTNLEQKVESAHMAVSSEEDVLTAAQFRNLREFCRFQKMVCKDQTIGGIWLDLISRTPLSLDDNQCYLITTVLEAIRLSLDDRNRLG